MSKTEKKHVSIVVIGHVDSGKSTTTGHLIYKLGGIKERDLEKYREEARKIGKESFCFAWILDKMKEERERGITINICLQKFETRRFEVTVIDAPGHRDFIKNMITGTSSADCSLLVVDAVKFETGISENGQTREHALLAYTLGVKQMIVAINKMDAQTINYSQKRFTEIKSEVQRMLKKIGFNVKRIPVLPVSGFAGENITEPSEKMKWWDGGTLEQAIDNIKAPKRPINKPLRMPIKEVYKIRGVGTVATGRVESGVLRVGAKIVFVPLGKTAEVRSIEKFHKSVQEAYPGDEVGFNVSGISANEIKKGNIVGELKDNPPREVESFVAQIVVLNHPGRIKQGYQPVVDCHVSHVSCKFSKLIEKMEKRSGKSLGKDPEYLSQNEAALVELTPSKPLVVEEFKKFPSLGRFAVRDMKRTVCVGVVKKVNFKKC